MSQHVKVYTKNYCYYCTRAKSLLQSKGVDFEEINLEGQFEELTKLKERTGWRTVPQIFIGDEFIGGYMELAALDRQGELDKKLNSPKN